MLKSKYKQGKGSGIVWAIVGAAAVVLLLFAWAAIPEKQSPDIRDTAIVTSSGVNCGSTLQSALTVDAQNIYNTSGAETNDTSIYFYQINADGSEQYFTKVTDTTAGALTLTCGLNYKAKMLSTSGAQGDPSTIRGVSGSGISDIKVNDDGTVSFSATGERGSVTFKFQQHAVPQIRLWDLQSEAAYVNNSGGTTAADAKVFNTSDGVNFTSTGTTGIAVGSGGKLNVRYEIQAQAVDENYNDAGIYILIDAGTTVWNTDGAVGKLNGATLTDVKSQLNAQEKIAYSAYELVYLIPASVAISNTDTTTFELNINALAGQNPASNTDDIQVDFAPIGRYTSIADGNILKMGAVDDSTSRTQVNTLWDTRLYVA